jgi:para-nitrobenzyl esterase
MSSVVATDVGTVEGTAHEGYLRFLGIPYAKPPVGTLRFRAAEPAEAWTGVLLADRYGPHAPQPPSPMETFLGGGAPMVVDEAGCLRLNVWTAATDNGKRPVMVWIHGGGFTMGTSATSWYDGARFAVDHDVVVVSFNYRLGVLGFTHLGDLAGPEYEGSGSLGVRDAAAVLRWVRTNIAGFGGDPDNVTIFGESAGAMSVGSLLGLPEARGLFHRAILQSGAASSVVEPDEAAGYTAELLAILGIDGPDPVTALQQLPFDRLLEAQQTLSTAHPRGLVWRPVVDGTFLDRRPLAAVADGAASAIPILIGTNLDEWRLFGIRDPAFTSVDEGSLRAALETFAPAASARVLDVYRRGLPAGTPLDLLSRITSDATFRIPAIRLAEAQTAAGGQVWMYLFTWPSPQASLGACHAIELPFVFNNTDKPAAAFFLGDDPPVALASDMNRVWATFSRAATADWSPYNVTTRTTMIFDADSHIEADPMSAERAVWDGAI